MKRFSPIAAIAARIVAFFAIACSALKAETEVVSYETFGAMGDGVADDLPAICKAHDHANKNGLTVRSKPDATYHLGRKALTANIATDTDWSTSRFIIDDNQDVENHEQPLFEVRSLLKPVPLKIDNLKKGQTTLAQNPEADCLVFVENKNKKMFIRRGLNQNSGTSQKEVFLLRRDGTIEGGIDWDYDVITKIKAYPIDTKPLQLKGGIFTSIASEAREGKITSYWGRNIHITRSNTIADGVTHKITGEKETGHHYSGFINVSHCANIILRNCQIDARKFYQKIGNAGKPVAVGTYGYQANYVVNLQMLKCHMENIHDGSRWGVVASNFMKNFLVEDCVLSRVDVHQGISGAYIIRRSTIGHGGINAIGRGKLVIEDSIIHSSSLIRFRDDYGSTWDGEIFIRKSRWLPPSGSYVMFRMDNDGAHDFGYPCAMPHTIHIDGLFVDDANQIKNYKGLLFFGDPTGSKKNPPFPYRFTERMEIRGLKTASGLPPAISTNHDLTKAIKFVSTSPLRSFTESARD